MCGATGVCCDRSEITEAVVWQYRNKWVTRGLTQCQRWYCYLDRCQCSHYFGKKRVQTLGYGRGSKTALVEDNPTVCRDSIMLANLSFFRGQINSCYARLGEVSALISSVTMGQHSTQEQTPLSVNQGVVECSGPPMSNEQSSSGPAGHLDYHNAHFLSSIDGWC